MSVEAIRLQNFMAFKDTGWLELRPVTLLFGCNSSGKSVITRSLLLLRQSLDCQPEEGCLRFADERGTDIGIYREVVHGQQEDLHMTFGFKCSIASQFLSNFPLNDKLLGKEGVKATLEISLAREADRHVGLTAVAVRAAWEGASESDSPMIFWAARESVRYPEDKPESWMLWSDFVSTDPDEEEESVWQHLVVETYSGFLPCLPMPGGTLYRAEFDAVSNLVQELGRQIEDFLRTFQYLGPIRAEPQRMYLVESPESSRRYGRGEQAMHRFLVGQGTDEQYRAVDDWLRRLDLGVEVSRSLLGYQHDSPVLFELKVHEDDGLQVNLQDVGFGAGQILPVVIQSVFAQGTALVIIEQPELHLHPRAQAELGSLLAHVVGAGVRLLIETHSENLILRMRRLMAETTLALRRGEFPKPELRPDILGAYFVDRARGVSTCELIQYDEWGKYVQQPPGFQDFFSSDFDELLALDDARLEAIEEGY